MRVTQHHSSRSEGDVHAVPPAQLRTPGDGAPDAITWLSRVGLAAFILALGWLLFAVIRPLPGLAEPAIGSLPVLELPGEHGLQIAERERILTFATGENIFNPERSPWSSEPKGDDSTEIAEEAESPATSPIASTGVPAMSDIEFDGEPELLTYDDIELAKPSEIPVAVVKSLRELELRGIYGRDGGYIAQIGKISNKRRMTSEGYAVGQKFDDENWQLLAIDPVHDRVILRRSDSVNVELTMYAPGLSPRPLPSTEESRSAAEAMATVALRTPEEARSDLEEGGVSQSEIDELLRLAEGAEDQAEDGDKVASADNGDDESTKSAAAPAGLSSILKMMARNPFEAPGESSQDEPEDEPAEGDDDN